MSPSPIQRIRLWARQNGSRLLVFLLLLIAIVLIFKSGFTPAGLMEILQDDQAGWRSWISDHPLQAAAAYAIFYMLMVSVSLPGALWFTIGAGYLLGARTGVFVSLIGVSVGATNILLLVRYFFGKDFHKRFDGKIERFVQGFQRNDFSYIILLRLLPTPFFLINVAAALLGARMKTFFLGTLIGSVPAAILYANLGAGLAELVDAGVQPSLADLGRPSFLIMLAMSLVLAITPFVHRYWRKSV